MSNLDLAAARNEFIEVLETYLARGASPAVQRAAGAVRDKYWGARSLLPTPMDKALSVLALIEGAFPSPPAPTKRQVSRLLTQLRGLRL